MGFMKVWGFGIQSFTGLRCRVSRRLQVKGLSFRTASVGCRGSN